MKKRILSLAIVMALVMALFVIVPTAGAADIDKGEITLDSVLFDASKATAAILSTDYILTFGEANSDGDIEVYATHYAFIGKKTLTGEAAIKAADIKKLNAFSEDKNKRSDTTRDLNSVIKGNGVLVVVKEAASGGDKLAAWGGVDVTEADFYVFAPPGTNGPAKPAATAIEYSPEPNPETGKITVAVNFGTGIYEYAPVGSAIYSDYTGSFNVELYKQDFLVRTKANSDAAASKPLKFSVPALLASPGVKVNPSKGEIGVKAGWEVREIVDGEPAGTATSVPTGTKALAVGETYGGIKITTYSVLEIRIPADGTKGRPPSSWTRVDLNLFGTMPPLTSADFALAANGNVNAAGGAIIEVQGPDGKWKKTKNWTPTNWDALTATANIRRGGSKTTWPSPLIGDADYEADDLATIKDEVKTSGSVPAVPLQKDEIIAGERIPDIQPRSTLSEDLFAWSPIAATAKYRVSGAWTEGVSDGTFNAAGGKAVFTVTLQAVSGSNFDDIGITWTDINIDDIADRSWLDGSDPVVTDGGKKLTIEFECVIAAAPVVLDMADLEVGTRIPNTKPVQGELVTDSAYDWTPFANVTGKFTASGEWTEGVVDGKFDEAGETAVFTVTLTAVEGYIYTFNDTDITAEDINAAAGKIFANRSWLTPEIADNTGETLVITFTCEIDAG